MNSQRATSPAHALADARSCGVTTTLDLPAALRTLSRDRHVPLTARELNDVVAAHTCAGAGLFVTAITSELVRRGIEVPLREVELALSSTVGGDQAHHGPRPMSEPPRAWETARSH